MLFQKANTHCDFVCADIVDIPVDSRKPWRMRCGSCSFWMP